MMKLKNIIVLILSLSIILGCETKVDIDVNLPDDKIVIDGWIESGGFANVLLTSNTPYFSRLDSSSIRDLVLSRAKVSVVNRGDTSILNLRKNESYFPPVIYQALDLKGEVGEKYTIIAEYGGKTAIAETSIPDIVKIDSVYAVKSEQADTLRTIYLEFTDLPGKNYYRIFVKRNTKDSRYKATFIVAMDDVYFSESKAEISMGGNSESLLSQNDADNFVVGDTVSIKLCTMDKMSFDFWSSFQEEMVNVNNPFAASLSEVKSNVSDEGLGVWSGYGVSYKEIILK